MVEWSPCLTAKHEEEGSIPVALTFNYFRHRDLAETEVTSTHKRPVENFVITTKGLQDRNNLLLGGRTVENKGKLILCFL